MVSHNNILNGIEVGKMSSVGNLSIIPLYYSLSNRVIYKTLPELDQLDDVTISELDSGPTVGELWMVNGSTQNVLIVDGEELSGAKQNRSSNATFMIGAHSRMILPVSCTEHGRWSPQYDVFNDSGVVMPYSVRCSKKESVDDELKYSRSYESDQSRVWSDISKIESRASYSSPTGAMKDVYTNREEDINIYLRGFDSSDRQHGMIVMIGDEVAGLELFSQKSSMTAMFPKLLRSYAIDAMLTSKQELADKDTESHYEFLEKIRGLSPTVYESIGIGSDYRFEEGDITGSALVSEGEVVQATFYNKKLAARLNN